jgi:hypothetical protein
MTNLLYLDRTLISTDSPPSSAPRRHRPLTDAERRELREYGEEYAQLIGPDYWKPPPIDSVQDSADMDENTEQRFEG